MLLHLRWLGKGDLYVRKTDAGLQKESQCSVAASQETQLPPVPCVSLAVHTLREVWSPPASQLTCQASLLQTPHLGPCFWVQSGWRNGVLDLSTRELFVCVYFLKN